MEMTQSGLAWKRPVVTEGQVTSSTVVILSAPCHLKVTKDANRRHFRLILAQSSPFCSRSWWWPFCQRDNMTWSLKPWRQRLTSEGGKEQCRWAIITEIGTWRGRTWQYMYRRQELTSFCVTTQPRKGTRPPECMAHWIPSALGTSSLYASAGQSVLAVRWPLPTVGDSVTAWEVRGSLPTCLPQ